MSKDRRPSKEAGEILGTASILSLLGEKNVTITSLDSNGLKLERPDLDVKFDDGTEIGIEQADVAPPDEAKHDAETGRLEAYFWDLLETDDSFPELFGSNNVAIFLSSHAVGKLHIQSKNEGQAIQAELESFFRSGAHSAGGSATAFSSTYPTLHGRGATWHSNPFPVARFTLGHTGGNGISLPASADVTRVLEKHRKSANKPGYRTGRTWITLLMTGRWEFFRDTLDDVRNSPPPIEPFECAYLQNDTGRVLELRSGGRADFVGMFAK